MSTPPSQLVRHFAGEVPDQLGWEEYNLCYIESEDGIHWERPLFDMWPRPGYPKTNILLDFPSGGRSIQGCVMINPDDDPDEPYEMFAYREPCFKCPSMVVEGMNQTHDVTYEEAEKHGPYNQPGWKYYGIYRHKSKDGIKWRTVEGPLFETGDTCSVFGNPGGGYTAHSKVGIPSAPGAPVPHDCYPGQTRTMWRRTSPDGSNWSERTLLITPDWRDQVGDQIMQADRLDRPAVGRLAGRCKLLASHSADTVPAQPAGGRLRRGNALALLLSV